jgi:glutamine amidotransferase
MIQIVDYGSGNINAIVNIYKGLNMAVSVVKKPEVLRTAEKVILPGVGSFDHVIKCLNRSGMRGALNELVLEKKKPILGICVGMQIMANKSEEGVLEGLGWIAGEVKKLNGSSFSKKAPLPHMGWNNASPTRISKLFINLEINPLFYFLHSYYFSCSKEKDVLAVTEYGDKFASAVNSGNIFGVQFHPEKSHQWGIQLLKNFGNL